MSIWPSLHSLSGVYDEHVFLLASYILLLNWADHLFCRFFAKIWSWRAWKECFGVSFLAGLSGALILFVRGGTGVFFYSFLFKLDVSIAKILSLMSYLDIYFFGS